MDECKPLVHGGGDEAISLNAGPELRRAIFLGRTEYTVRSVDSATGRERWNVTHSELQPLRRPAAHAGGGGGGDRGGHGGVNTMLFLRGGGDGGGGGRGGAMRMLESGSDDENENDDEGSSDDEGAGGEQIKMMIGPGNIMRAVGRDGCERWTATMTSVPLGAFDHRSGEQLFTASFSDPFPAKGAAGGVDGGMKPGVYGVMHGELSGASFEELWGAGEILVGSHAGGLYALPRSAGEGGGVGGGGGAGGAGGGGGGGGSGGGGGGGGGGAGALAGALTDGIIGRVLHSFTFELNLSNSRTHS